MPHGRDIPLAPLTTLGVGGPARSLAVCEADELVIERARAADRAGEPLLVLGGGSNVVVADRGFRGVVIQLATRGVEFREAGAGRVELEAAAGERWDDLVAACVARGLAGVECLSGIPGLVGATPIQNVGAYGQQVSDCIRSVRVYDRRTERVCALDPTACRFSYRSSLFKREARDRYIVLSVGFALRRGDPAPPRYGELSRALQARCGGRAVSLQDVREAVLQLRRAKSMVIDPADPDSRSVGSFFVNPVVAPEAADVVERSARELRALGEQERMPRYPAGDGKVKLAAAWLIERAGFRRGYLHGRPDGAALSRRHALAIVNRGAASASDVIALARELRAGVRDRFGVELQPEPVLVGFSAEQLQELGIAAGPKRARRARSVSDEG